MYGWMGHLFKGAERREHNSTTFFFFPLLSVSFFCFAVVAEVQSLSELDVVVDGMDKEWCVWADAVLEMGRGNNAVEEDVLFPAARHLKETRTAMERDLQTLISLKQKAASDLGAVLVQLQAASVSQKALLARMDSVREQGQLVMGRCEANDSVGLVETCRQLAILAGANVAAAPTAAARPQQKSKPEESEEADNPMFLAAQGRRKPRPPPGYRDPDVASRGSGATSHQGEGGAAEGSDPFQNFEWVEDAPQEESSSVLPHQKAEVADIRPSPPQPPPRQAPVAAATTQSKPRSNSISRYLSGAFNSPKTSDDLEVDSAMGPDYSELSPGIPNHMQETLLLQGWMSKQGGSVKSYKRRWFILTEHRLYYYEDSKHVGKKKPQGIIPLWQGFSVEVIDLETFQLPQLDRVWVIKTESTKDLKMWCARLEELARKLPKSALLDVPSGGVKQLGRGSAGRPSSASRSASNSPTSSLRGGAK